VTSKGITPINRLVALDLAEDRHDAPTQRAQTPGELDYSHLGSLKLGTLSIVNGAPSPAPSTRITQQRSRLVGEDDYFSAADAGSSPLMMKTTRRRGHVKSKSSVLPATAPLYPQRDPPAVPTLNYTSPEGPRKVPTVDPRPALESVVHPPTTNEGGTLHSHDASKYAQDYQAYLPNSPFANAKTFGHHYCEERFETTGASPSEEAARILAGTIFDAPTTAIETSGSSLFTVTSPAPAPEKPKAKQSQRPAPRTADSGYSSGGSLRTGSRSRQSAISTTSSKPSSSKDGVDVAKSFSPDSSHESVSHAGPVEGASEAMLSPTSTHSVASKSSTDSSSSAQRRLQRRRPSQPELPVVQSCQSIPENVIPDVPNSVRAKFTRRLSHTPGMECLTHTYPSKDHVTATESVGESADVAANEIFTQLTELEPERPPTPPAHGRQRSLSLFRRKSTVGSADAHKEDGVVDLGSIASSLGSSPYDAAMSRPQRKTVTSPTHPHQLGAPLPRAKSMVSMDSQAAAEFARMRSKDRALVEQEKPPQRRRSHHNLKMEVGEAKASKRRPQSALHDIPPVPAIDSSMLKAPLSAKPRLESEMAQKTNLSFSARSQAKGQVVSQHVDSYEQQQPNVAQHNVDWDAHTRHWNQRRKSIGEGLKAHAGCNEASASTVNSRNMPPAREDMANWGRYSGGLEYNYEGQGKISGSAGTRQLHSAASSKSLHWRNQYGVDLSDVPIMLQRA